MKIYLFVFQSFLFSHSVCMLPWDRCCLGWRGKSGNNQSNQLVDQSLINLTSSSIHKLFSQSINRSIFRRCYIGQFLPKSDRFPGSLKLAVNISHKLRAIYLKLLKEKLKNQRTGYCKVRKYPIYFPRTLNQYLKNSPLQPYPNAKNSNFQTFKTNDCKISKTPRRFKESSTFYCKNSKKIQKL